MSALTVLTGRVFGRLTVTGYFGMRRYGVATAHRWKCRCICGSTRVVFGNQLTSGKTISCGCFAREKARTQSTTHGGCGSPEYGSWQAMHARCSQPNHKAWKNYGGRGISVCARWSGEHGFENFLADVGRRPSVAHTLDRFPNNDGNYEPGNVRWAARDQQNRNRRGTHPLTFNGKTQNRAAWAEQTGIPYETLRARLDRYGWSVERALGGR